LARARLVIDHVVSGSRIAGEPGDPAETFLGLGIERINRFRGKKTPGGAA
jgi:hypothetical protein